MRFNDCLTSFLKNLQKDVEISFVRVRCSLHMLKELLCFPVRVCLIHAFSPHTIINESSAQSSKE